MEWKSIVESLNSFGRSLIKGVGITQQNIVSQDRSTTFDNMGPHTSPKDTESLKSWFPGQKLVGHIMGLTSNICGGISQALTQTVSSKPSFQRLNSYGESEDEFSHFPTVVPMKEIDMAASYGPNIPQPYGLRGSNMSGSQSMAWRQKPDRTRTYHENHYRAQYPQYGFMPHWSQLPAQQPTYWHPPPRPFLPWTQYQPPCYMYPDSGYQNQHYNSGIFHFRGQSPGAYKPPMARRRQPNQQKYYESRHRNEKRQGAGITTSCTKSTVKKDCVQNVCDTDHTMEKDICREIEALDISSDKLKTAEESQVGSVDTKSTGVLLKPCQELLKPCQARDIIQSTCESTDKVDYVNTEISLVSDLFSCPLKDNDVKKESDMSQSGQQIGLCTPQNTSSTDMCDSTLLSNQTRKPDIRTACIVLTPKTTCLSGSKKKKSRPSSKKRQRQKLRSCPEGHVINVPKKSKNKKQRTASSNPSSNGRDRSEPMSFVIDFSESESDTQPGSPPKISSSPVTAKFSLFISAGDLSDDETTDSDESSDSDFFDEETSSSHSTRCSPGQDWQSLFPQASLSPFTFKITCFTSPSPSKPEPEEDEVDGAMEADCPEILALKQRVKEANEKWQQSYDLVSPTVSKPKVNFPYEESSLQTVHVLSPDEVEAYREARLGKWEELARDRERFKKHIGEVEEAIGHCLQSSHREAVYQRLQNM